MQLDPVRLKLLKLVKERRTDLKNVSLAIGRNAAYLHQFVQRGTPKVLPEDVRAALAEHLGCEEDELRHRKVPPRKPRTRSEAPRRFTRRRAMPRRVLAAWPRSMCAPRPGPAPSTKASRRSSRS